MSWALYAVAGMLTFSMLVVIAVTGRERKPLTPVDVIMNLVWVVPSIVICVLAARSLR